MKRLINVFILLSVCACLFGDTGNGEPVPYDPEEFPPWVHDLRRAEIIMIGSIPVSIILSGLVYSLYRWAEHDFSQEYSPGIFGSQAAKELDETEKKSVLTITVSISGLIALADFIIGKVETLKE